MSVHPPTISSNASPHQTTTTPTKQFDVSSLSTNTSSLSLVSTLYGHESAGGCRVWFVKWRPNYSQVVSCGGKRILLWETEEEKRNVTLDKVLENEHKKERGLECKLKAIILNEDDDIDVQNSVLNHPFQTTQPTSNNQSNVGLDTTSTSTTTSCLILQHYQIVGHLPHSCVFELRVGQLPSVNGGTHERTVRSASWTRDGKMLAAASFDATTSVWAERVIMPGESDPRLPQWICTNKIEGHENEVKSVDWSPDATHLVTCSRDKSIWINELCEKDDERRVAEGFCCSAVLMGHTQDIKCVRWHPTRKDLIISASYDNLIKAWIPKPDGDWRCAFTITGHSSTVWSIAFDGTGDEFASSSDDKTVRIWTKKKQLPPPAPPSFPNKRTLPSQNPNPIPNPSLTPVEIPTNVSQITTTATPAPPYNSYFDNSFVRGIHPWLLVNPAFRAGARLQSPKSKDLTESQGAAAAREGGDGAAHSNDIIDKRNRENSQIESRNKEVEVEGEGGVSQIEKIKKREEEEDLINRNINNDNNINHDNILQPSNSLPSDSLPVPTAELSQTPALPSPTVISSPEVDFGWYCSSVIQGYHTRAIYSVDWHPTLPVIATASGDHTIRIFQRNSPPCISSSSQESQPPSSTSLLSEPEWVFDCSYRDKVHSDINSVSWKSYAETDGSWLLASGGDDGAVRIFKYIYTQI